MCKKSILGLLIVAFFSASSANAAIINYLSGYGNLDAIVTRSSPADGISNVVDQHRSNVLVPTGGNDRMYIDSVGSFDGLLDLEYSASLTSSGFSLSADVLTATIGTDIISTDISASASIRFTVDTEVNATLTGVTVGGEAGWFYDLDELQYFWTETRDGAPVGIFNITLTPGNVYSAGAWTGFGHNKSTILLELATIPVPGAVWLFSSALIGLAGIGRKKHF